MTDLDLVLTERHSTRAFLARPVEVTVLQEVFGLAQRTASWCNTQPWQVTLVSGPARAALARRLRAAAEDGRFSNDLAMPEGYEGVYAERRRASGYGLYSALGIARDDREARAEQMLRNYDFFGAPHVAIITTDRLQSTYGAIDCGGYVATLLLAAGSRGLGTCAQAAIAMVSDEVRDFLDLPAERQIVCAVAIGYEDTDAPANTLRTDRADVATTVTMVEAVPDGVR